MSISHACWIHYNGKWVVEKGHDTYIGEAQPVILPDKYTLEDVKNQAKGVHGFSMGPDFDVYGVLPVKALDKRQKFVITDEAYVNFYHVQMGGMPSFFITRSPGSPGPGTPQDRNVQRRPQANTPPTPPDNYRIKQEETDNSGQKNSKVRRRLCTDEEPPPAGTPPTPSGSTSTEKGKKQLKEGETFKHKDELKTTLDLVKLRDGFDYKVSKSSKTVWYVKCIDPSCSWSMRATLLYATTWFVIKKMNDVHSCTLNANMSRPVTRCSKAYAAIFQDKFYNPLYTSQDLAHDVKQMFGRTISYKQASTAKKRGLDLIRGPAEDSYQYLVRYSRMLEIHNPGTVTAIETDGDDVFQYYFFAFGACVEGFKSFSRPAFGVDGTHLEGEFKHLLLSAIAFDANGQLFPIAFAIVDSENDASCAFFMRHLRNALGDNYSVNPNLLIITDRSDHLHKAIESEFPDACHVFCAYHIKGNLVKNYGSSELAMIFMEAANAYTEHEFHAHMEEFRKQSQAAADYLNDIGPTRWARVKSLRNRFTLMTTNLCESWNAMVKSDKKLPIHAFVDSIRRGLMEKFHDHRKESGEWSKKFTPHADEFLTGMWLLSRKCQPCNVSSDVYEVWETGYQDQYLVDMTERSCSCGVYKYENLPCQHMLSVCEKTGRNADDLCADYYQTSVWRCMYAPKIHPVIIRSDWHLSDEVADRIVLHPGAGRGRGRPKEGRYLSVTEKPSKQRKKRACSKCKLRGHYATSVRCRLNKPA